MSRQVAVIGLGTMGRGIASVVARAGHEVRAYDPVATSGADGVARCDTIPTAVRGAKLVIEAVPEDPAVKARVLAAVSRACDCPLATNTSALPLASLARSVVTPGRFLATHFFNPADLVPGVEVAAGPDTDPAVVSDVVEFLTSIGKEPIRVGANAGFVANRIQLALFLEALACVADGMATAEDVDRVVRRTFGFRLPAYGPFAVADMAGLDVYASILRTLEDVYGPRFAAPVAVRDLVERGRLGVKVGAGFREYSREEIEALLASRDARYRQLLEAAG